MTIQQHELAYYIYLFSLSTKFFEYFCYLLIFTYLNYSCIYTVCCHSQNLQVQGCGFLHSVSLNPVLTQLHLS